MNGIFSWDGKIRRLKVTKAHFARRLERVERVHVELHIGEWEGDGDLRVRLLPIRECGARHGRARLA